MEQDRRARDPEPAEGWDLAVAGINKVVEK